MNQRSIQGDDRTGTRIYGAMVSKPEADGGFAGGPTRQEQVDVLDDEHRHFVRAWIRAAQGRRAPGCAAE